MCRIAGIISNRLIEAELSSSVAKMCDSLSHGGPDDSGIYNSPDAGLCFGHRRLSIIDLSSRGHQPMPDAEGNIWITFNGEIYNFLDLKEELIRLGSVFTSDTDTEVIIHAYKHWGIKAFGMLRGIFAFALYDRNQKLTYLVRDSGGIKPLYFYTDDAQLTFASEVKAFKASGLRIQQDKEWRVRFLAFGHIPEPYTTLKDVFSLPKGQYLCWDHNSGTYQINPYLISRDSIRSSQESLATDIVQNNLTAAIERQLLADAPIGVFLSGGIDSSILALVASSVKKEQLKTVSIYFDEESFNERKYQQEVTDQLSGENFSHLVTSTEFKSYFNEAVAAMDMPTTDGINSWFISKYARGAGLKAVLSGVGADELFGGYPSFKRIRYLMYLRLLPAALLRLMAKKSHGGYQRLEYLTQKHPLADYLFLRGLFTPSQIAAILDLHQQEVANILFDDKVKVIDGPNNETKASWLETNLYMQNQLLRDTDMMSMSHGLEVRVPFLDEDFQQAVSGVNPVTRFANKPPKKLLIDSFKKILPESVWKRKKMGFSFPLQQWMKSNDIIGDDSLYQSKAAKKVISDFKNGKAHWSKAFALYHVEING